MIKSYEFGYTPSNLKALRKEYALTQAQVGQIVGVTQRMVARWEVDLDGSNHSNMPYVKWQALLSHLNKKDRPLRRSAVRSRRVYSVPFNACKVSSI